MYVCCRRPANRRSKCPYRTRPSTHVTLSSIRTTRDVCASNPARVSYYRASTPSSSRRIFKATCKWHAREATGSDTQAELTGMRWRCRFRDLTAFVSNVTISVLGIRVTNYRIDIDADVAIVYVDFAVDTCAEIWARSAGSLLEHISRTTSNDSEDFRYKACFSALSSYVYLPYYIKRNHNTRQSMLRCAMFKINIILF